MFSTFLPSHYATLVGVGNRKATEEFVTDTKQSTSIVPEKYRNKRNKRDISGARQAEGAF